MPAASCGLPPTRGTSTRNQGPPSPRSSRLAWPPEPYLVVELPPAPETQLQEFTCVPLDDFQADSAKRKPGSRGLECRCRGWNSSSQIAQGSDRPLIPSYTALPSDPSAEVAHYPLHPIYLPSLEPASLSLAPSLDCHLPKPPVCRGPGLGWAAVLPSAPDRGPCLQLGSQSA